MPSTRVPTGGPAAADPRRSGSVVREGRAPADDVPGYFTSKRSRSMTFAHAATKSATNLSFASSEA